MHIWRSGVYGTITIVLGNVYAF